MKKTKDVFICYKRSDGEDYAKCLFKELINIGYSVFLDTEVLQSGKYEGAIYERIKNSTDFIIIVTPDFSNDANLEWIKKELDCAIASKCNIVPIYYTDEKNVGRSISYLNEFNGINAIKQEHTHVISRLVGTYLLSNQDVSFKEDPEKDELSNLKDYLHRHTTRAFMEIAIGAFNDDEIHDSNYTLGLLAQESDYDVITCLWVVMFKCVQILDEIKEASPNVELVKSFMKFIEDVLAKYAILIDEGKLDTANRFFPEARDLLIKIVDAIGDDELDKESE